MNVLDEYFTDLDEYFYVLDEYFSVLDEYITIQRPASCLETVTDSVPLLGSCAP